jgi:hypothetical protein
MMNTARIRFGLKTVSVSFLFFVLTFASIIPARAADFLDPSNFGKNTNANALRAHPYFGLETGVSQASGTAFPLNSGFVYGATAGVEVLRTVGVGLTYQHSSLTYQDSGINTSVHQLLLEINAFSLLILNGGFHVGDVIKFENGTRTADLGFGFHAGFDAGLTEHLTIGVAGYVTFVLEKEDHHSLLNLMVPLKWWF